MQDEACSAGVGPGRLTSLKCGLRGSSGTSSLALPLEEADLISVDQWRNRPNILDCGCPNPAKPPGRSSFIKWGRPVNLEAGQTIPNKSD